MKSRESAVPSVLSSAIELLSDTSLPSITHSNESSPKAALSNISVISPATAVGGGGGLFGMSGVSRMASRSPSPTRTSFVYTTTGPIPPLSSSSTAGTVSGYGSGSGSPRPHPERSATLSSMTTTSGTLSAGGTAASSPRMSPTLLSPIVPDAPPTSPNPLSLPPSISSLSSLPPSSLPSSSVASSPPTAHPSLASEPSARSPAPANPGTGSTYPTPSTIHKRLSFLSYTDLLSSTPSTSIPLSSLVSPTSSDPPPHISALSGISASSNASIAGDWDERSINGGFGGAGGGGGGMGAGGYGGGGSTYGAGMEEVDKFGMSLDVGGDLSDYFRRRINLSLDRRRWGRRRPLRLRLLCRVCLLRRIENDSSPPPPVLFDSTPTDSLRSS
ncbi:hypothetical protein SISSUDRAFT_378483 [Sistotremastrum suecicum HHB10207 ss-3]|uniref:Uncharacterized protein n=1 Tax=Sistotremastrum suecicum HHB10207 ss-3 TaxID=1314776 RepID=A0A165Z185_9AGAM|nr:hypothetical protein SISSUDRAFT_378483 [Sistotremastrum suecicum HHB10207 ss-3]